MIFFLKPHLLVFLVFLVKRWKYPFIKWFDQRQIRFTVKQYWDNSFFSFLALLVDLFFFYFVFQFCNYCFQFIKNIVLPQNNFPLFLKWKNVFFFLTKFCEQHQVSPLLLLLTFSLYFVQSSPIQNCKIWYMLPSCKRRNECCRVLKVILPQCSLKVFKKFKFKLNVRSFKFSSESVECLKSV